MTATAQDPTPAAVSGAPRSLVRDAWDRLRRNRLAMVCGVIVMFYLLVAAVAYAGLLNERIAETVGAGDQPPSLTNPTTGRIDINFWFGTDLFGRSVFWRAMYGARVALTVAICAGLIEIVIGTFLGAVAGYFGGWIDAVVVWLFSTMASIPYILLLVAFAYALKDRTIPAPWETLSGGDGVMELAGIPSIVLALGLTSWVGLCRLIRAEVIKHRGRDYVVAARAIGAGHIRTIFRHILPNVLHLVIISFTLGLAGYVQAEVILSFLGLGVTDVPSWGRMIDDAKLELLKSVWWQMTVATVLMFIFCLASNVLGDAARDALDPRLRGVD
jgi:peptide/nickel transport system permease protein